MMCMTELHGGVCHRTSTPHKSGNKMKEKKKIILINLIFNLGQIFSAYISNMSHTMQKSDYTLQTHGLRNNS